MTEPERAITLLKVAKELLERQDRSSCVLNILTETVHYDGADCDGYCLLEDINAFLEMEGIKVG